MKTVSINHLYAQEIYLRCAMFLRRVIILFMSMASSKPTSNVNKTLGFIYDGHLFFLPNMQGG